jgi:hypothetical protein
MAAFPADPTVRITTSGASFMTMNRRDFLVSTAVMTAGATVKGLASPNDTVRMAVVGCGGRGQSHVSAWSSMPNVEIVALCDVDQFRINEKLKYLESKGAKKPVTYVDMRKMLEDKNIDAVSIATPNHWHALQTIWAVQAGKDVYVEKPCTHNIFESQQIVAAARKYNRLVQQGSQSRSSPALREAVQRMRDGELGEVYMARGLCYKWRDTIGRYPDGPMKSGETSAADRNHATTARICRTSTTICGLVRRQNVHSIATASITTGTGSGTRGTEISATRASTKSISHGGAWASRTRPRSARSAESSCSTTTRRRRIRSARATSSTSTARRR